MSQARNAAAAAARLPRVALTAARALARGFRGESVRLRAMALTYTSLFAVVPVIVVVFAVVEVFTGTGWLARLVHDQLLENLAVGARTSIADYLDRFVRNTNATRAGLVGGGLLVWSLVSLFGDVERAMNDLWAVRRRRPLRQRLPIYWAGITLGPLLLAASLALGHAAHRMARMPLGPLTGFVGSVVLTSAFFAVLYFIVPATRVRLGPAAGAGLAAGMAWELAKALYTFAVARFFRFHAVYGSVAAIPIFLVWLYLSWAILLYGARVAFVLQHARALVRGHGSDPSAFGRELLAARVVLEVALAFDRGEAPPDPGEVALRLETLGEPVREALSVLRGAGLVLESAGGGQVPARPLAHITLADVRQAISGPVPEPGGPPSSALVAGILAGAEGAAAEKLAGVTYEQLCQRARAQAEEGTARSARQLSASPSRV